jgi:hypothetical protein
MRIDEISQTAQIALRVLPEEQPKEVLRVTINRTNQILLTMFRSFTPVHTGALLASAGVKIKAYRGGRVQFGIVGARSDYAAMLNNFGKIKRVKKEQSQEQGLIKPYKYLHLVEEGTKQRRTKEGTNRGKMPALHFMHDIENSVKEQARDIFEEEIMKQLNRL